MIDYYPTLNGAVSRLATNNPQTRQQLYERGRTILIELLRSRDPEISAPEAINHELAFEVAIIRVEDQLQSVRESSPKGSEDFVPLSNTNYPLDIASLLVMSRARNRGLTETPTPPLDSQNQTRESGTTAEPALNGL